MAVGPEASTRCRRTVRALEFWKRYPFELFCCRNAINAVVGTTAQVLIAEAFRDRNLEILVPAVFCSRSSGPLAQLGFTAPTLQSGYTAVRIVIGKKRLTAIAYTWNETWITENSLKGAHEIAETALTYELERRGMDSSALVVSGRLCCALCGQLDEIGPMNGGWPECFEQTANTLSAPDLNAISQADRLLIRLRRQIDIEATTSPKPDAKPDATTPATPVVIAASSTLNIPVESKLKGVAPRNAKFLEWYEASGSDTFHKPKRIQEKWWGMTATARTEICPDNPGKVTGDTVVKGIKLARKQRGG